MLIEITLIFLSLIFLTGASIEDIRKGEVSDRTSYGFLVSALLVSAFFSLYMGDWGIIIKALSGGLMYFALGFLMYIAGIWGGADAKILAAVGCVLGNLNLQGIFLSSYAAPVFASSPHIIYLVSLAACAIPYLAIYGIIIGIKNPLIIEKFLKRFTTERDELINEIKNPNFLLILMMCLGLAVLSAFYSYFKFLALSLLIPVFFTIIFVYLKVVEKEGFTKTISVDDLREYDWLVDRIEDSGVQVAGNKLEGISQDEISEIKRLRDEGKIPDRIKVREGMRFIPALLFGFLLSLVGSRFFEGIFQF